MQHVATIELNVEGMHCASYTSRIENAIANLPGVVEARANLATDQASVDFDDLLVSVDALNKGRGKSGLW